VILGLLASTALAAGLYAGVAVEALPILSQPVFLESESGWVATVDDEAGGTVRLLVAPTEGDAAAWYELAMHATGRDLPAVPIPADQAHGDAHALVLFREGNVVGEVRRPRGGAYELCSLVLEALEPHQPWPDPPEVSREGSRLQVAGDWAQVTVRPHLLVDPDTLLPRPVRVVPTGSGRYLVGTGEVPVTITVWDRFGRAAVSTLKPESVGEDVGAPESTDGPGGSVPEGVRAEDEHSP